MSAANGHGTGVHAAVVAARPVVLLRYRSSRWCWSTLMRLTTRCCWSGNAMGAAALAAWGAPGHRHTAVATHDDYPRTGHLGAPT